MNQHMTTTYSNKIDSQNLKDLDPGSRSEIRDPDQRSRSEIRIRDPDLFFFNGDLDPDPV